MWSFLFMTFLVAFTKGQAAERASHDSKPPRESLTLRSDILARAGNHEEGMGAEDNDGSREALRILRWAEKRGLGPAAITPSMILQRRSSIPMASEATIPGVDLEVAAGKGHRYTDLAAMLEAEVFDFPDHVRDGKVEDEEAHHLVQVPELKEIVRSIRDNDFHSKTVGQFWSMVFQLSDDLAVSTFLRAQNFPDAKAQFYLDQYMSAGANDDLKTDIIVDILSSNAYSFDQESGSSSLGDLPKVAAVDNSGLSTMSKEATKDGFESSSASATEDVMATPLPFTPNEVGEADGEATVEDDSSEPVASSTTTMAPPPLTSAPTTTASPVTKKAPMEAASTEAVTEAPLNAHNRGASSPPGQETPAVRPEATKEAQNNSVASDRSDDNLSAKTFEWTRARRRAWSGEEPKEDQFRTLKMKVHKSVGEGGGQGPWEPQPQAQQSQPRLSGFYEGYLIIDIRIVLVIVGLWLFLFLVVLVRFRVLSTAAMLGLLRPCGKHSTTGGTRIEATRKEL